MAPQALLSQARYVRSSTVVSREIGGETLVVPIRGGVGDLDSIFSFNSLGSDLWRLLDEGMSIEEMTGWVVERYDVAHKRASADVASFLEELCRAGLIQQQ